MKILLNALMLIITTNSLAIDTKELVYLGEFGLPNIQHDWTDKNVSTIIGDAQIEQFIIIKSSSSAPLELHTRRVQSQLQEGHNFQDPKIDKPMNFFFDAILLMDDGRRFRVRMNASWICLTSPTGSGYLYTANDLHFNARENACEKK